jgi:hypothetical protein
VVFVAILCHTDSPLSQAEAVSSAAQPHGECVVKHGSFLFYLAMRMMGAVLDPSSTTTAVKNVFRHVTDVLQLEFKHGTAIGPELSKEVILHVAVYDL